MFDKFPWNSWIKHCEVRTKSKSFVIQTNKQLKFISFFSSRLLHLFGVYCIGVAREYRTQKKTNKCQSTLNIFQFKFCIQLFMLSKAKKTSTSMENLFFGCFVVELCRYRWLALFFRFVDVTTWFDNRRPVCMCVSFWDERSKHYTTMSVI